MSDGIIVGILVTAEYYGFCVLEQIEWQILPPPLAAPRTEYATSFLFDLPGQSLRPFIGPTRTITEAFYWTYWDNH